MSFIENVLVSMPFKLLFMGYNFHASIIFKISGGQLFKRKKEFICVRSDFNFLWANILFYIISISNG